MTPAVANGQTVLKGGWGQSPAPIDQPQEENLGQDGDQVVPRGVYLRWGHKQTQVTFVPASSFSHPFYSGPIPWQEKLRAMAELQGQRPMSPHPHSLLLINHQVLADVHGPGPVLQARTGASVQQGLRTIHIHPQLNADSAINLCIRPQLSFLGGRWRVLIITLMSIDGVSSARLATSGKMVPPMLRHLT